MGRLRDKMDGDLKLHGRCQNTRTAYLLCATMFVRHEPDHQAVAPSSAWPATSLRSPSDAAHARTFRREELESNVNQRIMLSLSEPAEHDVFPAEPYRVDLFSDDRLRHVVGSYWV